MDGQDGIGQALMSIEALWVEQNVTGLVGYIFRYDEQQIMDAAIDKLKKIGDSRVVDMMVAKLRDRDPVVVLKSLYVLGSFGDTRAVDPVIQMLKHKEPTIRQRAVIALGQLGDPTGTRPILGMLDDRSRPQSRESAPSAVALATAQGPA
jgi:HEAT repeat protein